VQLVQGQEAVVTGRGGCGGGDRGEQMGEAVVVAVNGERYEAAGVDPSATLLEFLRTRTPVRGPKLGCGEGTHVHRAARSTPPCAFTKVLATDFLFPSLFSSMPRSHGHAQKF